MIGLSTAESSCAGHPYHIPRLYVEGLEADEYLLVMNGEARRLRGRCRGNCYGKAIYGVELEDLIDLVEKKAKKSFIVVLPPEYRKGLLIRRGATLEPIPLRGQRVILHVCEGDRVEADSTIGFVVTGKHEVRHIRSHVAGRVVYIYSSPYSRPDHSIVFIAPRGSGEEEEVVELDVAE